MGNGLKSKEPPEDQPARLIRNDAVRVLNCSAAGCLLEATHRAVVNSVAVLHVSFGDKMFDDLVQVVRCVAISDGGNFYHIAIRFLSVAPPYASTLRHRIRTEIRELGGWLDLRVEDNDGHEW
jgi:hypothetical protein